MSLRSPEPCGDTGKVAGDASPEQNLERGYTMDKETALAAARKLFPAGDAATVEKLQPLWESLAAVAVTEAATQERQRVELLQGLANMGFTLPGDPVPPLAAVAEIARRQAEAVAQ